jgi:hypothetical protein
VKILDYDLTSHDDKVGKVPIPMTELASLKEMTVPLLMQTKRKTDGVPTALHHYLPSLVSQGINLMNEWGSHNQSLVRLGMARGVDT